MQIARRAKSMIAVASTAVACSCGGTTAGSPSTQPDVPKQHGTPLMSATIAREGATQKPWSIVRALSRAGFAVTNPLDTTADECLPSGCQESVVTDQLRVKSFASPNLASRYAKAAGSIASERLVVAFAPPLSPAERAQYWTEIVRLAEGAAW